MPNHVTTILKAVPDVLKAIVKDGRVDFNTIIPSFDDGQGDGIRGDIETLAESCLPFNKDGPMAGLTINRMLESDVTKLDDECFDKFIQMLKNKREHGYLHCMEFNRAEWGTKWNAYDQLIGGDSVRFDTAWSLPEPVIAKLSLMFPSETISVEYADEDTGSNCGWFSIKNGSIIKSDIAPSYSVQSTEERLKWRKFAFHLKQGPDANPIDWDMDENYEYIDEDE